MRPGFSASLWDACSGVQKKCLYSGDGGTSHIWLLGAARLLAL